MSWPLSHDFNEAIQNPRLAFTDPELKAGEAVVGARGLPLPRSGTSRTYQVRGADGKDWAVKCFTRPVVGLAERYARVSDALEQAKLPFVVGFTFLPEGMLVAGARRPVVKMEWVEGLLLNQVVRENAAKPPVLAALGQMWVRLCRRLREARIAHADLQHGNVLLVPGARPGAYGLKLIDYDGMYVPALANQPSGETGHPAYQHPTRAATRAYSPDVDRFPHLVVLAALKGLEAAGLGLWERHDTGDNLLFTEDDFKKPAESKVMRELWKTEHPAVQALVGRLALACGKPIPQTPWVDEFAPDGDPSPLDNDARRAAAAALGVSLPVPVTLPPEPTYGTAPVAVVVALPPEPSAAPQPAAAVQEVDVELVEERKAERKPEKKPEKQADRKAEKQTERKRPAYRPPTEKSNSRALLLIAGGVLLLAGGIATVVALSGNKQPPDDTVQKPGDGDNGVVPPKDKNPVDPKGTEPKEKQPKDKGPLTPQHPKPKEFDATGVRLALPDTKVPWAQVKFSADGRWLVASIGPHFRAFDAQTGAAQPPIADVAGGKSAEALFALTDDRLAYWVRDATTLPVIDLKTGRSVGGLSLAGLPGAKGGAAEMLWVSPDGRYVAGSRQYGGEPVPVRVMDAKTSKVVVATDWPGGSVQFTGDGSRVLRCSTYAAAGGGSSCRPERPTGSGRSTSPRRSETAGSSRRSQDGGLLLCLRQGTVDHRHVTVEGERGGSPRTSRPVTAPTPGTSRRTGDGPRSGKKSVGNLRTSSSSTRPPAGSSVGYGMPNRPAGGAPTRSPSPPTGGPWPRRGASTNRRRSPCSMSRALDHSHPRTTRRNRSGSCRSRSGGPSNSGSTRRSPGSRPASTGASSSSAGSARLAHAVSTRRRGRWCRTR